jgi:hypothetical protein
MSEENVRVWVLGGYPEKTVSQLQKGDWVMLRNGWAAQMVTVRGNRPTAEVYGYVTEIGSVYAHDIMYQTDVKDGKYVARIRHTPAQLKLKRAVDDQDSWMRSHGW